MKNLNLLTLMCLATLFYACSENKSPKTTEETGSAAPQPYSTSVSLDKQEFDVILEQSGRYEISFFGSQDSVTDIWLEDYIENKDRRTYNITGNLILNEDGKATVYGSPLAKAKHPMRVHFEEGTSIDSIRFTLMIPHSKTPTTLTQKMDGENWNLVWSDEFEGEGLADSTKWTYNVGNWGWGNNELQYYTSKTEKNARLENGYLIIEAYKNEFDKYWTSARLTTQGKVSFKYGKIEFRAKVPHGRGTWSAGWLLGDAYRDELSWPYCGEIDVLECVGYEIDDALGTGLNHATCHTRAYYFKQGNQIGSEIEVDSMHTKFHTFAVEWTPTEIKGFLDGTEYYVYDKNADELEWPFNTPQNIIVNLAIGGGWGGAKGVDSIYTAHQYVLDYVRVYEKI